MSNQAAWITEKQGKPLKVDSAPMPSPSSGEVVVKNGAVAVNPVDWKIQDYGAFLQKYPSILGEDSAGEIVEVGPDVTDFKKGDRVLVHSLFLQKTDTTYSGFQHYTRSPTCSIAKIPDNMSFTDATVLPLAIATASAGLYQDDHLGLPHPSTSPKDTGKVILVWGGSSSVGAVAVQLAKASGLEVFSTASKHNHDFVQDLGASQVFDYNDSSIVEHITKAIKSSGKEFAGVYDSIALDDSQKASAEILMQAGGSKKMTTTLPPSKDLPEGVQANGVFAVTIYGPHKHVGEDVVGRYVPGALKSKQLRALPQPLVVGKGLEHVQKGLDTNKKGVSAKKVVIEL